MLYDCGGHSTFGLGEDSEGIIVTTMPLIQLLLHAQAYAAVQHQLSTPREPSRPPGPLPSNP
jgi:hypothetical protein